MDVVPTIMDYWLKTIEVIGKMDTNILNAMIQSLATLLAVAVGFFFSILTERRQWKRAKSEEIRTYQLSAVLELTYHIQKVLLILEEARYQHNKLYSAEKNYETIENITKIRKEDNISSIRTVLNSIDGLKCEINKKILELRILNYKQENINMAKECIKEIDDIIEKKFNKLFECELNENIFDGLKKKLNYIIEEAENGLRQ